MIGSGLSELRACALSGDRGSNHVLRFVSSAHAAITGKPLEPLFPRYVTPASRAAFFSTLVSSFGPTGALNLIALPKDPHPLLGTMGGFHGLLALALDWELHRQSGPDVAARLRSAVLQLQDGAYRPARSEEATMLDDPGLKLVKRLMREARVLGDRPGQLVRDSTGLRVIPMPTGGRRLGGRPSAHERASPRTTGSTAR